MRLMWKSVALLALGFCGLTLTHGQEPLVPASPPVQDEDPDKEIEVLLKKLPADLTPQQREQAREMIKKHLELKKRGAAPDTGFPPFGIPDRGGWGGTTRLGVEVQMPPASLIEQLDLPKNQGLVLGEVKAESAAGKAGLKSYDVLLELDSKPISRDLAEFNKILGALKEDAKVSLVVLRKGKNETIKELALTRAQVRGPGVPPDGFHPPEGFRPPEGFPMPPAGRDVPNPPFPMPGGGQGVMTTVFRTGDRFTARHQEGSLIITLTGEMGKVKEIKVQDGREGGDYESVEKTPNAYRDKVRGLVEMIEKSNVKIEIKEK